MNTKKRNSIRLLVSTTLVIGILLIAAYFDRVHSQSTTTGEKQKQVQAKTKAKPHEDKNQAENKNEAVPKPSNKLKVIQDWEEYDATNLPLIAAIPQNKIYLYGVKPEGVVLYINENGRYFNWSYMTPRFILPTMSIGDYDNDGDVELTIIPYVGSGTGVAIEELHIIELAEKEYLSEDPANINYMVENPKYFKDIFFNPDDYINQLDKAVKLRTYRKKSVLLAEIKIGKNTSVVSLADYEDKADPLKVTGFACGDVVHFNTKKNKLEISFGFGIATENYAPPFYIGDIYGDVNYKAGKFTISNLRFTTEEEY